MRDGDWGGGGDCEDWGRIPVGEVGPGGNTELRG